MTTFNYTPRPAAVWESRAHQNHTGERTAISIIDDIRKAKGELKLSASGHLTLTGERIPQSLFEMLQDKREEITAVLATQKEQTKAAEVVAAPTNLGEFVETRREYLRCVTCGHWRCQHCTKRKIKPGEVQTNTGKWRGFVDLEGSILPCSHTLPDVKPYACDSTACAVRLGEDHYCPCKKFISPNAKKRVAKPRTPKALNNIACGTLIPKADLIAANRRYVREEALKTKEAQLLAFAASESDIRLLTAKQIAGIVGGTQTWVRQVLKKIGIVLPRAVREKTEFTTGTLPVITGNDVQP